MAYGKNRLATALGLDKGSASSSTDDEGSDDDGDVDVDDKSGEDYAEAELAAAEDVTEAFKEGDAARVRDALKRFIEICTG